MIENCTLYFSKAKIPWKTVFPKGRSAGGFFRKPTWFEFDAAEGAIRLNLELDDLPEHLQGFRGYVAQLPNSGESRAHAQALIGKVSSTAGVLLPGPIAPDSDAFAALVHLINEFDGFMFVADSIMLPDCSFLVGPMAETEESAVPPVPQELEVDPDDYRQQHAEGADPLRLARRETNYCQLARRGFRCARWLPLLRDLDTLRPQEEIVGRALALSTLFHWVAAPERVLSTADLQRFITDNEISSLLARKEAELLALPREEARAHVDQIGWRLENLWALAWVLGLEQMPLFWSGQLPEEASGKILDALRPAAGRRVADYLAAFGSIRPLDDVVALEDLYYCAHNAVRSAQSGSDSVPADFHPVRDGGTVHERRHALSWCLSTCDWDETDLST